MTILRNISVKLPIEAIKHVERLACEDYLSKSDIVRLAVLDYLRRKEDTRRNADALAAA